MNNIITLRNHSKSHSGVDMFDRMKSTLMYKKEKVPSPRWTLSYAPVARAVLYLQPSLILECTESEETGVRCKLRSPTFALARCVYFALTPLFTCYSHICTLPLLFIALFCINFGIIVITSITDSAEPGATFHQLSVTEQEQESELRVFFRTFQYAIVLQQY